MIIRHALDLLSKDDWMVKDEDIQIAKGLYEIPVTIKEFRMNIKRKKLLK